MNQVIIFQNILRTVVEVKKNNEIVRLKRDVLPSISRNKVNFKNHYNRLILMNFICVLFIYQENL